MDVSAPESVRGLVYIDRKYVGHNILTSWFWGMFEGLLADSDVGDMLTTWALQYTARTSKDANYQPAWMEVGSSNLAESFLDYYLKSSIKAIGLAITLSKTSTDSRVVMSGATDVDAQEVAIISQIYDTGGSYRATLHSRKVISVPAGKTITWALAFGSPWVFRIAEIMYGFYRDADSNVVQTDGSVFTARTSGDFNAGSAYLVYSATQTAWSTDLYAVPNAQGLSMMYWNAFNQRSFRLWGLLGSITPGTDVTVNTLGIYQPIFDTAGNAHTVCLAVLPLSTPVTFYANRINLVMLRIVAA